MSKTRDISRFIQNTAIIVPSGTSAQRPTANNGYLRYNTDTASFEGYTGGAWGAIGGSTNAANVVSIGSNNIIMNAATGIIDASYTTGVLTLPSGNTEQRPATAANGSIRWNTTSNVIEIKVNSNWYSPVLNTSGILTGNLTINGGANTTSTNTGTLIITGGIGATGNIFIGGSGYFVGNVYSSYSDTRLKTVLGTIENPINKVNSIETFYYEPNELAVSLGVDAGFKQIGVSAQSVQSVMPEAVGPSPVNKEYLTVQYERLVPLLIEAIKEQQQEILNLKDRVTQLENK